VLEAKESSLTLELRNTGPIRAPKPRTKPLGLPEADDGAGEHVGDEMNVDPVLAGQSHE
jgi:hypothetical protein